MKENYHTTYIYDTDVLISQYINYKFLPIVTGKGSFLYSLEEKLIGKYQTSEMMKQYMQRKILESHKDMDIIRLY